MTIIKQIGILFTICWLSNIVEYFLPFDFPASVIGLILLLLAFLTGTLKLKHIREKSNFLLSNMAFFFIPAGVSMINYFSLLKNNVIQLILICFISTILTFVATAYSIRFTLKILNRRNSSC